MARSPPTDGELPEIREEPLGQLAEHARISIAFEVNCVLEVTVERRGLFGLQLIERPLAPPYVKDYDAIPGNHATEWARRIDLSKWGLLSARFEGRLVGGALIAFNTDGVHMLEGRSDLAVLWDLRVAPKVRRRGVGRALFVATERWAKDRRCSQLKIETQNINVAACKFYASRGCELGAIHRFAYPDLPHEVQLLWYKDLCGDRMT
jgi:GNAT superfamily N-acetyltransferase